MDVAVLVYVIPFRLYFFYLLFFMEETSDTLIEEHQRTIVLVRARHIVVINCVEPMEHALTPLVHGVLFKWSKSFKVLLRRQTKE